MAADFKSRFLNASHQCLEVTRSKSLALDDLPNESAHLKITNAKQEIIYKLKLDNCLLTSGDRMKRCDWVLYLKQSSLFLLIELKARYLGRSSRIPNQFLASAAYLEIEDSDKRYILVCKVGRNSRSTAYQILSNTFGRKFRWISTDDKPSVTRRLSDLKRLSNQPSQRA